MLLVLVFAFLTAGWWLDLSAARLAATPISALLCAPILFVGVHMRCQPGPLHRVFETLGNASYSLYLFHPIFNEMALHLVRGRGPAAAAAAALTAAIVGGGGHLFIERPLVAAGHQWLHLRGHAGGRFFARAKD